MFRNHSFHNNLRRLLGGNGLIYALQNCVFCEFVDDDEAVCVLCVRGWGKSSHKVHSYNMPRTWRYNR